MYRDAIEATPGSKYLHIGGDEIGNIGLCPRCKPMADKEGMLSLSLYWLKRVCEFAKENGRIPIFWDDMPLKHGGVYESTWSDEVTSACCRKSLGGRYSETRQPSDRFSQKLCLYALELFNGQTTGKYSCTRLVQKPTD